MRSLVLGVSAVSPTMLAQTTVPEVIPIKFRTMEQVIPIIRPMLAPEGASAFIRVGQSVPVSSREVVRGVVGRTGGRAGRRHR